MIYFYFAGDRQIWLMTLYSKDEVADLTPDEKRALRAAFERQAHQPVHRRKTRRK